MKIKWSKKRMNVKDKKKVPILIGRASGVQVRPIILKIGPRYVVRYGVDAPRGNGFDFVGSELTANTLPLAKHRAMKNLLLNSQN